MVKDVLSGRKRIGKVPSKKIKKLLSSSKKNPKSLRPRSSKTVDKKVDSLIKRSQKKCSKIKISKRPRKSSLKGASLVKPMNVVLDLDNTLLNSIEREEFDKLSDEKQEHLLESFEHVYMGRDYVIFLRPGLQDFLDYLFKNFNVSVWTAASKDYMAFILKHIIIKKPNRKLDIVLYDKSCDFSRKNFSVVKDLRYLWQLLKFPGYRKDNTFLIDDLKEIYENDKSRVINIKSFEVEKKGADKDKVLIKMREKLAKLRRKVRDKVKKVNEEEKD